MNRSRASQCTGKARHTSMANALIAVRKYGEMIGDLTLLAYHCEWCGGFHTGHPPKAERNRLRFRRLIDLIDRANQK